MLKLLLCCRLVFTLLRVPLHLQLLQSHQLPDQVPLHEQDEASAENYPGNGQPAGEGEAEELGHHEREEDEAERLEEDERSGKKLRGRECREVKCWVGVEMFQGRLLVPPALLQPLLQTDVGGGERGKGVTHQVDVDLRGEVPLQDRPFRLRLCVGVSDRHVVYCVQNVPLHHPLGQMNEARGARMENPTVDLTVVLGGEGVALLLGRGREVRALREENKLLWTLLSDLREIVQHLVQSFAVFRPAPLEEEEPAHGHDPAQPRQPPHVVLQDELSVVVGPAVEEPGPEKVPVRPAE